MNAKRRAASLLLEILLAACAGTPTTPTPASSSPPASSPSAVTTPSPIGTPASPFTSPSASPATSPVATPVPNPVPTAAPTSSCVSLEVYVVVAGDTLWEIAKRHGVTLAVLLAANPQITNRGLIRPGDEITIPPRVIELGTPGGDPSFAADINDAGQVVGYIKLALGGDHAFLWEDGQMTDLGTRGVAPGDAWAINERGHVVGFSASSSGWRPFLWQDGATTYLPTTGGASSQAWDINDRGVVVGSMGTATSSVPVLWQDGMMIELGTLGGATGSAYAINSRGQVVGWSATGATEPGWLSKHAFLWQDGVITDLGTLGGARSSAKDINELGQIVGVSQTAGGPWHATLWQDGSMTDLGTLGGTDSFAEAINSCGQIVGSSQTRTGLDHVFLWQDGLMIDLGTAGGVEATARSINDRGQVVGARFMESLQSSPAQVGEAVMWTPTLPGIALNVPAAGATIVQNDPSTGCAPNATYGYGTVVNFAWTAPLLEGLFGYELVVRHIDALNPALDVRVATPSFTWTSCGSFVADPNLDNWHWQVTALDKANRVIAVSERRAISFLPCRLTDGTTACSAPG